MAATAAGRPVTFHRAGGRATGRATSGPRSCADCVTLRVIALVAIVGSVAAASSVAAAQSGAARVPARDTGRGAARDTTDDAGMMPAGYGTLRREDVAVEIRLQGLTIRAIPLEESVIRALAPDTYRSLRALRDRQAPALERLRARLGLPTVQAWHLTFFNVQQGEARYDPRGMQVRSAGRDYRPLDVFPLVPGFEDGRLAQGRTVDAVVAFDPQVALNQPLVVTLAGESTTAWNDVIPRLERERAAVMSRAAGARKPSPPSGEFPWR